MTGPGVPDPSERKFLLMRVDQNTDGSVSKTPIDPQSGSAVDASNPSAWMTFDEAKVMADAWGLQNQSPLVEFGVGMVTVTKPPPDPYTVSEDRTDAGNANLLIRLAGGNLRYIHETKQWLRWTDSRWQIDEYEAFVTSHALEVAKFYFLEARGMRKGDHEYDPVHSQVRDSDDLYKWAVKCRSKGAIEAMITLARKKPGVPISVNDLDRDPFLLGVENGVVDLRTGELRETDAREDYITKRCRVRYNPNARAPRWEKFIKEITGAPVAAERSTDGKVIPDTVGRFTPRPALARYLRKALGYSLTGSTREQKFFIAVGNGSNGKSVLFDVMKDVLGPYSVPLPAEMLLTASRGVDAERPTAFAAGLAGARFAVSSETKVGQKLDVAVVKNHTGDKEMTARRLYANPVTFAITHKLWLSTNERPGLDHIDPATRGRLHLLPFDRRWNRPGEYERDEALPDGDKTLAAQLASEAEGILAWLVQGAVLYQQEGLTPPDEVVALTRDYVLEQDSFGRWLATLQRCAPKQGTFAKDLFGQFDSWMRSEGLKTDTYNQTTFGTELKKRSVEFERCASGIRYGLTGGTMLPPAPSSSSTGVVAAQPIIPQPSERDAQLATALEKLGWPNVVTIPALQGTDFNMGWLTNPMHDRDLDERFRARGYVVVANPNTNDGRWSMPTVGGHSRTSGHRIWGRSDTTAEHIAAAVSLGAQ